MTAKMKALGADLIAKKEKPQSSQSEQPTVEALTAKKVYQSGEPMNFRVPIEFKRLFKATAAQHDLKMNELLVEAFEIWMREKSARQL